MAVAVTALAPACALTTLPAFKVLVKPLAEPACTCTDTTQLALAAKVPALRLRLPEPGVAVPPQLFCTLVTLALTSPTG